MYYGFFSNFPRAPPMSFLYSSFAHLWTTGTKIDNFLNHDIKYCYSLVRFRSYEYWHRKWWIYSTVLFGSKRKLDQTIVLTMILKHLTVMVWFCTTLYGKWQKPIKKLRRRAVVKIKTDKGFHFRHCLSSQLWRNQTKNTIDVNSTSPVCLFTNSSRFLLTLKSCHRHKKVLKFWWKLMKVFAPSQVTADKTRAGDWVASGLFLPILLLFVVAQQLPRHLVSRALLFLSFLFQAVTKKRGLYSSCRSYVRNL